MPAIALTVPEGKVQASSRGGRVTPRAAGMKIRITTDSDDIPKDPKDGADSAAQKIMVQAQTRRERLKETSYRRMVEREYNLALENHLVDRVDDALLLIGSVILDPDVREEFEDVMNFIVRTTLDISFQFVEEDLTYCMILEQQCKECIDHLVSSQKEYFTEISFLRNKIQSLDRHARIPSGDESKYNSRDPKYADDLPLNYEKLSDLEKEKAWNSLSAKAKAKPSLLSRKGDWKSRMTGNAKYAKQEANKEVLMVNDANGGADGNGERNGINGSMNGISGSMNGANQSMKAMNTEADDDDEEKPVNPDEIPWFFDFSGGHLGSQIQELIGILVQHRVKEIVTKLRLEEYLHKQGQRNMGKGVGGGGGPEFTALKQDYDNLQKEMEKLKDQLKDQEFTLNRRLQRIEDLETQFQEEKEKSEKLQEQLTEERQEVKKLRRDSIDIEAKWQQTLADTNHDKDIRIEELEHMNQDLQTEIATMRLEHEEALRRASESAASSGKMSQDQVDELTAKVTEETEARVRNEMEKEFQDRIDRERRAWEAKMKASNKNDTDAEMKALEAKMQRKMNELTEENAELKGKLAELDEKLNALQELLNVNGTNLGTELMEQLGVRSFLSSTSKSVHERLYQDARDKIGRMEVLQKKYADFNLPYLIKTVSGLEDKLRSPKKVNQTVLLPTEVPFPFQEEGRQSSREFGATPGSPTRSSRAGRHDRVPGAFVSPQKFDMIALHKGTITGETTRDREPPLSKSTWKSPEEEIRRVEEVKVMRRINSMDDQLHVHSMSTVFDSPSHRSLDSHRLDSQHAHSRSMQSTNLQHSRGGERSISRSQVHSREKQTLQDAHGEGRPNTSPPISFLRDRSTKSFTSPGLSYRSPKNAESGGFIPDLYKDRDNFDPLGTDFQSRSPGQRSPRQPERSRSPKSNNKVRILSSRRDSAKGYAGSKASGSPSDKRGGSPFSNSRDAGSSSRGPGDEAYLQVIAGRYRSKTKESVFNNQSEYDAYYSRNSGDSRNGEGSRQNQRSTSPFYKETHMDRMHEHQYNEWANTSNDSASSRHKISQLTNKDSHFASQMNNSMFMHTSVSTVDLKVHASSLFSSKDEGDLGDVAVGMAAGIMGGGGSGSRLRSNLSVQGGALGSGELHGGTESGPLGSGLHRGSTLASVNGGLLSGGLSGKFNEGLSGSLESISVGQGGTGFGNAGTVFVGTTTGASTLKPGQKPGTAPMGVSRTGSLAGPTHHGASRPGSKASGRAQDKKYTIFVKKPDTGLAIRPGMTTSTMSILSREEGPIRSVYQNSIPGPIKKALAPKPLNGRGAGTQGP